MAAKYKQQSDGRYQTKVWDGTYTKDNAKHYVPLYSIKSSRDLERIVADFKRKRDEGTLIVDSDMLFLDYAARWAKVYKAPRARGTQIMYEDIINYKMTSLVGLKLTDAKRLHFQIIINECLHSPRTCQQIDITFKQIIKAAVADGLLPKNSYEAICTSIDLPKYIPSEKRALTPAEKDAIKVSNFNNQENAFVLIAYGCGMRRGEILALTKADIDFTNKQLTVNKALAFDANNPYIKDTKTVNGERVLPMPKYLRTYLKIYCKSLKGMYLFTKLDGSLITKSSWRRMWANIVKKINLAAGGTNDYMVIDDLTAHTFRHNYCANLCYQMPDISIKKIAYLLGDTERMVIDVYNHILEEKENVHEVVEKAMFL